MTTEIAKKARLVVRVLGSCVILLSIWGLCFGSFSVLSFILVAVLGIAAGYALNVGAERLREKCEDAPLIEQEKQKLLRFYSMGKWKFVFIHGIPFYVGIMILMSLFCIWRNGVDNFSFWNQLLILGIALLFGIVFGLGMWKGIKETIQKYSLLENSFGDKR